MTSKIILKKSNVASKVPVAGDLDYGELALNYTDGKLWYKNNSNVITQLNAGLAGTVTVAQGGTGLTSYTANGVVYASGTGTLASGSALVFDGTTLRVNSGGTTEIGSKALLFYNTGAGDAVIQSADDISTVNSIGFNKTDVKFYSSGSEQMRLTSTGLGIGTSSPATKLHVAKSGAISQTGLQAYFADTGANNSRLTLGATNTVSAFITGGSTVNPPFVWYTNDGTVEQMRLDSSGNLGLGVTPSAWSASAKAIQFGAYAGIYQNASGLAEFSFNSYQNTSNVETYRVSANAAAKYQVGAGTHKWYTAPSGTAGNPITFTQAMTLDASGNLGIGVTSPAAFGRVAVLANDTYTTPTAANQIAVGESSGNSGYRMQLGYMLTGGTTWQGSIQSFAAGVTTNLILNGDGGNLGIGTSSPSYKLDVNGFIGVGTKTAASGAGGNIRYRDDTGTYRWAVGILGGAAATSFAWYDGVANAERMSIDSSGNLNIVNLTASKPVFTDASKNLTSTGTVPVSNGGTGATTLTGILKGNGTSAFTSATAGTDYVSPGGSETLTNKTVTGIKETNVALAANNIDLSTGNYFTKTITGATTLTVSNVPASGTVASFIFNLTNGGAGAITWWSGMKWAGGVAPTLTVTGRDALGFYTHDGGTTWTGLVLGKDVK